MKSFFQYKPAFVLCGLGLLPLSAYAHNPQVQIGIENNRIVTHGLFMDEPYLAATPAQRAYEIPMGLRSLSDPADGWYAEPNHAVYPYAGPGVALLNNNFAVGSVLSVGYVDGLKIWNGSTFVDPGAEQIAVSTAASFAPSILTTDAGPFNSVPLAAVTGVPGVPGEHKTLRWRLLGDGSSPNTASDDGVYLLSLQLGTNQAGIAASLPYYFLLSKNAPAGDAAAALAYVNANLVPEPAMVSLLAVAGLLLARQRRHRSWISTTA